MVHKELFLGVVFIAVLQCIYGQGEPAPGLTNPDLNRVVNNIAGGKTSPQQKQGLMKLAQALARQRQLRQQQQAQQRNPMDMWLNMQLLQGELEGPMQMYALFNLMNKGGMGGGGGAGGMGGMFG